MISTRRPAGTKASGALEAEQRVERGDGLDLDAPSLQGDVVDHARRPTLASWIARWAAVRRASGSGASGSASR